MSFEVSNRILRDYKIKSYKRYKLIGFNFNYWLEHARKNSLNIIYMDTDTILLAYKITRKNKKSYVKYYRYSLLTDLLFTEKRWI